MQHAIVELQALIASCDPIELLARVTAYISASDPDKPKDSDGPSRSETNLDYLLSLITAHPFPARPEFPNPDTIQHCINLVTGIHLTASVHLTMMPRDPTATGEEVADFADAFRLQKLHVRGDAYWPIFDRTSSTCCVRMTPSSRGC